ncbi:hypothetical protein [Stenotrophomonas phage RAS14]
MSNVTNFLANVAAAEKIVQANHKASWDWAASDRATRGPSPRLEKGADTVTMGNVSCKLSAPAQNARTNACRRNWKINGKRATEAEALAAL